ncbi:MAG: SGNH/GDSL hydrolase family protein [Bacteroidetes bacterium]|nr:MAG: SGNH/GDSL hydrolase family protein [Bacteroidota bacterium]
MENFKYFLGALLAIPLLPIMIFQGRRVRKNIPDLPEARGWAGIARTGGSAEMNLLVLGESTMAGVGVKTHEEGFSGSLAQALSQSFDADIHWKVYAKSGHTAEKIKDDTIPLIEEEAFDLIVIGLGGNDAFRLNPPMKWKWNLQGLITKLRNRFGQTPIVFINMPPIRSFPAFTPLMKFFLGNHVEILGDVLTKLVSDGENVYYYSRKITLEDWIARLEISATPADFFSDGVHPSRLTYQTWGRDTAGYIFNTQKLKRILQSRIKV